MSLCVSMVMTRSWMPRARATRSASAPRAGALVGTMLPRVQAATTSSEVRANSRRIGETRMRERELYRRACGGDSGAAELRNSADAVEYRDMYTASSTIGRMVVCGFVLVAGSGRLVAQDPVRLPAVVTTAAPGPRTMVGFVRDTATIPLGDVEISIPALLRRTLVGFVR